MDRELAKVIEEFGRAVNVETLYLAKKNGKHSISQSDDSSFSMVSCRARAFAHAAETMSKPAMTRTVAAWKALGKRSLNGSWNGYLNHRRIHRREMRRRRSDIYWVYGSPGIGKTSLAHSICANLQDRKQLAGAFFCRRDDTNLSDPRNILPTFIYKLARIFPHFRTIVAEHLLEDPNLTPQSMKDTLFVDFIRSLRRHPKQHTLVFVIDALDECGNSQSRPAILKVLIDAAALAPWLKIIITSRPEVDIIQCFLDASRRDMIWVQMRKPRMICEPSPEASSIQWLQNGISPPLGQKSRSSTE
jgi:hypothetical protein